MHPQDTLFEAEEVPGQLLASSSVFTFRYLATSRLGPLRRSWAGSSPLGRHALYAYQSIVIAVLLALARSTRRDW